MSVRDHVVLFVGGVGGAKLALGLAKVLSPESLTVVVNTADDFEHLGLHVSPDLDTVMYTLSGLANPETGWGVTDDSFRAMDMVSRYEGPDWFRLGDRDIGTNLMRTAMLKEGATLTEATQRLASSLGIQHAVVPMTDNPVRTWLQTSEGTLPFQVYFVRERWQPTVTGIEYRGAAKAVPSPPVARELQQATGIIFGPSNPFLSIDPILAVPGIRSQITTSDTPVVAVSPIVGGQAVKGPAAKLMDELGFDVSPVGVARHYANILDGMILDSVDADCAEDIRALGIKTTLANTIMQTQEDKVDVATRVLNWLEEFSK